MTFLKFVFAEMKLPQMMILQLNLLNSTSAEVYLMYYAAM